MSNEEKKRELLVEVERGVLELEVQLMQTSRRSVVQQRREKSERIGGRGNAFLGLGRLERMKLLEVVSSSQHQRERFRVA